MCSHAVVGPGARRAALTGFLLANLVAISAGADCLRSRHLETVCGPGACASDLYGDVYCSRYRDGGAATTENSVVLCGRGQCVRDEYGEVLCSPRDQGWAAVDVYGKAVCEEGCVPGSKEACLGAPTR